MNFTSIARAGFRVFNAVPARVRTFGPLARVLGANPTVITYVGRKSGKQISLPVWFSKRRDEIVVGVVAPQVKTWWRNFLGEGAPLTLTIDGETKAGLGVAHQSDGAVEVRITLLA